MKKERKIPHFKNEEEERKFWVSHDSTDYINWPKARRVRFPELKPSEKAISIRMPEFLIEELKILSNKRGLPYQSLLKEFLAERVEKELSAR
jgi:predicted DNA binding CopG/RHH family protein